MLIKPGQLHRWDATSHDWIPSFDLSTGGAVHFDQEYANLAAAVAAIGSTVATLIITTPNFPDGSTTAPPKTLLLNFDGGGTLTVASGHTVTINSNSRHWPERQLFFGSGTVVIASGPVNPVWFGATRDGTTDDATAMGLAWASAISGSKLIDLGSYTYKCNAQLDGDDGLRIVSDGATILHTNDTLIILNFTSKNDWSIEGPLTLKGTRTGVATAGEIGLHIVNGMRYRVFGLRVLNFKGQGIFITGSTSPTYRGEQGQFVNILARENTTGVEIDAGGGAEYTTWSNLNCVGNYVGFVDAAGNTNVTGGNISDNTHTGAVLNAGTNHAHGIFDSVQFNHNGDFSVELHAVLNGHTFADCHFYDGDIWIEGCKDVLFDGGILDPGNIYNDTGTGSGYNYITNMVRPLGGYGQTITSLNGGEPFLILTDLPSNTNPGFGVNVRDATEVLHIRGVPGIAAPRLRIDAPDNGSFAALFFQGSSANRDADAYISNEDTGKLIFQTGPSVGGTVDRAAITNDGRIGVGTISPATSALLELASTTGALLIPRMTTTQRNALTAVNGMEIYNSTTDKFQKYENGAWTNLTESETGTWTPTLNNFTIVLGGGTVTVTGFYVKVGNLVHLTCVITAAGGASVLATGGTSYVSGQPFTPAQFTIGHWMNKTTEATFGFTAKRTTDAWVVVDGWAALTNDVWVLTVTHEV